MGPLYVAFFPNKYNSIIQSSVESADVELQTWRADYEVICSFDLRGVDSSNPCVVHGSIVKIF